MNYVEATDFGTAPEIFIHGISKIEQITPSIVRFTYYSSHPEGNRVVLHVVIDMKTWQEEIIPMVMEARALIQRGQKPDGPRSPRPETH